MLRWSGRTGVRDKYRRGSNDVITARAYDLMLAMLGRQKNNVKRLHRIQMTGTLCDAVYGDTCVPELQDDMAQRLTPLCQYNR